MAVDAIHAIGCCFLARLSNKPKVTINYRKEIDRLLKTEQKKEGIENGCYDWFGAHRRKRQGKRR